MRKIILFTGLPLFCNANQTVEAKENRPNIVLIMADEMGYSDLGFMGSGIETPNIDKLAKNGVVFSQFYNTGRSAQPEHLY